MAAGDSDTLPPSGRRADQGRILRVHFACRAPLPIGSTLRVTSSVQPPPLLGDGPSDVPLEPAGSGGAGSGSGGDDQSSVASGDILGANRRSGLDDMSISRIDEGGPGTDRDQRREELRMQSRLLTNTVEMTTTPDEYPLWRTTRPVVVIDTGGKGDLTELERMELEKGGHAVEADGSKPDLLHRYRYVAVTPGSVIDWKLVQPREYGDHDSVSTGRGTRTVATTPPGSDDEGEGGHGRGMIGEEDDAGYTMSSHRSSTPMSGDDTDDEDDPPPVQYEDPSPPGSVSPGSSGPPAPPSKAEARWSDAQRGASFASIVRSDVPESDPGPKLLGWEDVVKLPYRTRKIAHDGRSETVEIVDRWNDPDDPAFAPYWNEKRRKDEEEGEDGGEGGARGGFREIMVTETEEERVCEDDELDPDRRVEGMYIVCYHLPVTVSRSEDGEWSAVWSESLIAKTELSSISSTRKTTWIGSVSADREILKDPAEREKMSAVLGKMNCIPVFFHDVGDDDLLDRMYMGFCKQVLWPSYHNVDLLDQATSGWGQRMGLNTSRQDPVRACAAAAAEAHARRARGASVAPSAGGDDGARSDWDQSRLDLWWDAFNVVNRRVSDVVAGLVNDGDIVWVHDYHLALLPRMLREARGEIQPEAAKHSAAPPSPEVDEANVGGPAVKPVRMIFFIHVPFPTSQVFRELQHGEDLLDGMLQADVVGFHAFDHARHFLNASKRILGLTYESLVGGLIGVRHRGTRVLVSVSNVSVEADAIGALTTLPSVLDGAEALRKKHAGRSIISGIAVAQRLSGVSYKLLAFERLLIDYPVWHSKVVLLQRCLIPGTRRVDEADTLREVRHLVKRIQDRFGPEVIDYDEQVGSVYPVDDRLSIWMASRVMMHAPIREGLNLCPLEYIFVKGSSGRDGDEPGVVIASEFAAVSSILNGALRVNPYDIQMCVTSIDSALSMSLDEREARKGRDIDFVSNSPSGLWTRNVLRDLNDATLEGSKLEAIGEASPDTVLAREAELCLERLDPPSLEAAYSSTRTRVFIIDFNGTLVVKEPAGKYLKREILGTSGFRPSAATCLALQRLCSDRRNTVYVVSGDSQANLEAAMGGVPGLGLAASNGTCFSDPGSGGGGGTDGEKRVWQYLEFGVDWAAVKKVAMPIISKFTARTNGSYVKLSHSSIGWSYYSCDPEWGSLQASHLVTELGEALRGFDVRFVALKGIVEVVPRNGHKGHIVKNILERVKAREGDVDFVLCMGDDIADEKMFTSVINFSAQSQGDSSYAFNVAVGKKPTNASFYVDSASDVGDILVGLSGDREMYMRQQSQASESSVDFS
mmetsp:Transcript_10939/g.23726  ORF Transcript_10939/g.23726 Transcript_10939/m.23726 type:complete len:1323 (+) Transcript_10939:93-4061(+)